MKKYRLIFSIIFYTILFSLFSTFAMADNNNAKKRVVYRTITINPSMSGEKIQAIFRNLKSVKKIIFKNGRYVFNRTIKLRLCKNIEMIGQGKVELIGKNPTKDVIFIQYCGNITLKNIRFRHLNKVIVRSEKDIKLYLKAEKATLIKVKKSNKIKILNCYITFTTGFGIIARRVRKLTISGCEIFNNLVGIFLNSCENVLICKCNIFNNKEPFGVYRVRKLKMKKNTIEFKK